MDLLDRARLSAYLARVGYDGPLLPTFDTLLALHRAHLNSIPYENFDIHLGRSVTLDRDATFEKLVARNRGGWCFEMNGTFGWVLQSVGFDVRHISCAVRRAQRGDAALDTHLALIVTLDRQYLADVGFGDGLLDPLPLEPGRYRQQGLEFQLSRDGGWWRFHNQPHGGADSYDFTLQPRTVQSFARKCHELQTSPESGFVRAIVCSRYRPNGLRILRGAILRDIADGLLTTRTIADADDYNRVLVEHFDLNPAGSDALWPIVQAQHAAWMGSQAG